MGGKKFIFFLLIYGNCGSLLGADQFQRRSSCVGCTVTDPLFLFCQFRLESGPFDQGCVDLKDTCIHTCNC